MLEYISIFSILLLIIFEIIFTLFCVKKIIQCEKRVDEIHLKMLEGAKKLLEINDEVRNALKKINKVVKILTNKRLHQVKRIFMMSLDIIQTIILFRSLNLSKGLKSVNFGNLKKLAYARIIQQIIGKIINSIHNLCAI
jgi:hypothetical protein